LKNVLPGKRRKRLFAEEIKKIRKKPETNPPEASQLRFLVLPQGQSWQLAGWQPACGCLCSAPKATGRGQEALKGSQFGGWVGEGNCKQRYRTRTPPHQKKPSFSLSAS